MLVLTERMEEKHRADQRQWINRQSVIIFPVTRSILNMVNQRADLLASNYLIRAEQRPEAVPEGKVMLSSTVPTLPQYLIIKIKEGRCSLGTKGRTKRWTPLWARKSIFFLLPSTALCSQVIYNFWCARTLHHTLYQHEDATFEQSMLLFKLTVILFM